MGRMKSIKNLNFKAEALHVVEVFELSIEHAGFPQSELETFNKFYDHKFGEREEEIKKQLMSIQYDFFGGTNFKDRDDPNNKVLFEKLTIELIEVRKMLE